MTAGQPRLGTYGFALRGIDVPQHLLVAVGQSAPTLGVHRVTDLSAVTSACQVGGTLVGGGEVRMDLESGDAYYVMPRDVPDDEMLHPWLAPAAYWRAYHLGRLAIHGGLISADDRAVAVIGEREAGKSSLTAWVAASRQDLSILTDDVIVVDGIKVFAGPRCIDVRPPALGFLGERLETRPSRDNTRYRIELPPCRADARLVGIVVLEWADFLSFEMVRASLRLPTLLKHLAVVDTDGPTVNRLLALAALPMWILARPRDATLLDRAVDALAQVLRESR